MVTAQQLEEENSSKDTMDQNGSAPLIVQRQTKSDRKKMLAERKNLVLWKSPINTLKYAFLECAALLQIYGNKYDFGIIMNL